MVTLNLSPELEEKFRQHATRRGQSLEAYLEHLLAREELYESAAQVPPPEELSEEEVERLLDQISEGLTDHPNVPDDFSRADIYADHD